MSVDPARTFLHQGMTNTSGHFAAFLYCPSISKKYCASFQLQSFSVIWIITEKMHPGKRFLKNDFYYIVVRMPLACPLFCLGFGLNGIMAAVLVSHAVASVAAAAAAGTVLVKGGEKYKICFSQLLTDAPYKSILCNIHLSICIEQSILKKECMISSELP